MIIIDNGKSIGRPFCRSFAEYLQWKVRKEIWGYAADEVLSTDDMIAERY
jgi:5-methyltetrahydrofolate--homocysteine methyltransferase